jgi:hypothetical protein
VCISGKILIKNVTNYHLFNGLVATINLNQLLYECVGTVETHDYEYVKQSRERV